MVKKVSCSFCASRCGVLLHIDNGRITKVQGNPEHPVSRGWTCSRGRSDTSRWYRQELSQK
ncbi:hypothetical protein ACFLVM_03435 [Chloroflexota bacterium]